MVVKKYLTVIIIIAAIIGSFFGGQYVKQNNIENDHKLALGVGRDFSQQLIQNKTEKAYNTFTSKMLKDAIKEDEFNEQFKSVANGQTSKESGSLYLSKTNALYLQPVLTTEKKDGIPVSKTINLILEKEDGEWKVLSAILQ